MFAHQINITRILTDQLGSEVAPLLSSSDLKPNNSEPVSESIPV